MIAVRLSNGEEWTYMALEGASGAKLARLSKAKQVVAGLDGVNLVSEQGGVIWRQINEDIARPKVFSETMLGHVGPGWINLYPGERLSFGKVENASYNDLFDVSLCKIAVTEGFVLAPSRVEDGDLVMSAWSNGVDLQPARFRQSGARVWLELVEPHKVGERCFVVDETGRRLVSVSLPCQGHDFVKLASPRSFVSWLWAADSSSARAMSERFEVKREGSFFSVQDLSTGKRYIGRYRTGDKDEETQDIHWALTSDGIGGLVLDYALRRA
jgi:hypothetical protein